MTSEENLAKLEEKAKKKDEAKKKQKRKTDRELRAKERKEGTGRLSQKQVDRVDVQTRTKRKPQTQKCTERKQIMSPSGMDWTAILMYNVCDCSVDTVDEKLPDAKETRHTRRRRGNCP